jgi:hypothetical protein
MKFFLALGFLAVLAAIMAAGVVKLIDGKPLLLLATLAIYSLLFYRVGCTEH